MDTTQIEWDYVVTVNYELRNYSIIAYLQRFPIKGKKNKKNLQKINDTSSHTKTTNRIISPVLKQNIFFITPEQNEDL